MTTYVKTGQAGELDKLGFSEVKEVAPSPPLGPTSLAGLGAMIVGVVVAVLSLFDVVPTDEDVQALGAIIGAALFAVPYVVMAISRTKQANSLAKLASDERLHAVAVKTAETFPTFGGTANPHAGVFHGATNVPRTMLVGEEVRADELLGAPVDKSLEVPGGGPRPEDVADAAKAAVRDATP